MIKAPFKTLHFCQIGILPTNFLRSNNQEDLRHYLLKNDDEKSLYRDIRSIGHSNPYFVLFCFGFFANYVRTYF